PAYVPQPVPTRRSSDLKNVGTEPAGTIDATIIAADLAPLVEALGERFPNNKIIASLADHSVGYPGLFEDASIRVVGTSPALAEVDRKSTRLNSSHVKIS